MENLSLKDIISEHSVFSKVDRVIYKHYSLRLDYTNSLGAR